MDFENVDFSFTCGRTKAEVFYYDDVIYYTPVALRLFCEGVQRFYVDGRKKNSNTLRVDRVLLLITLRTMKKNSAGKCDGLRFANESTQAKIIWYLPAWGFPEGVEQLFGVTHHGTFEFL